VLAAKDNVANAIPDTRTVAITMLMMSIGFVFLIILKGIYDYYGL